MRRLLLLFPAFTLFSSTFLNSEYFIDSHDGQYYYTIIMACLWALFFSLNARQVEEITSFPNDRIALFGIVLIGAIQGLYGIFHYLSTPSSYGYTIAGSFDNTAGFAMTMATIVPFGYKCYEASTSVQSRLICTCLLIIIIGSIFFSRSRTGFLMVVTTSLIMGWKYFPKKRKRLFLWGLTGCIPIFLFFLFWWKHDSSTGRLLIWRITIGLILTQPIWGYGLNGFTSNYMESQAQYLQNYMNTDSMNIADNVAHPLNEFLNIAVNFGLIGLLCAFSIVLLLFRILLKVKVHREMTLSLFVSLLICFSFSYPTHYVSLWCMMGFLLLIILQETSMTGIHLKIYHRSTIIGLSLLCLLATIQRMKMNHQWKQAALLSLSGNTQKAIPYYNQLYKHFHHNPFFCYNYASELNIAGEYAKSMRIINECQKYLDDYDVRLLKADNYLCLGDTAHALQEYQMASDMIPCRFIPLYYQFDIYRQRKDYQAADKLADIIINKVVKIPSQTIDAIKADVYSYLNNRNLTSGDRN